MKKGRQKKPNFLFKSDASPFALKNRINVRKFFLFAPLAVLIALTLICGYLYFQNRDKEGQRDLMRKEIEEEIYQKKDIFVEQNYYFILADTPEKRNNGLSKVRDLPDNVIMFFSYDKDNDCAIWMKDMKFSIDVIWIDKNFKVIDFKEGVSPDTFPQIFSPNFLCKYFIEANQGFIKNNNIKIGDEAYVDFVNSLIKF